MRETLTTIGRYRILGLLGEGGMGLVYRCQALDPEVFEAQGGPVAVKLLHRHLALNAGVRERFEAEAQLGMALDHPGIVKVHALIQEADSPALVMELVEGAPLSKLPLPLPLAEVWAVLQQVGDALAAVHAAGIVHRDLKPANIMRTPQGRVVLLDFGIAKQGIGGATRTGLALGTVQNMAPEQYTNAKAVDARADVYATALLAFELLAGAPPWPAELSEFEILTRKAQGDLLPLASFRPELPAALSQVLALGLQPDPAQRFQSVSALIGAMEAAGLAALAQQSPQPPAPEEEASPRRDPDPGPPPEPPGVPTVDPDPPAAEVTGPLSQEPPDSPPVPRRRNRWLWLVPTLGPLLLLGGAWVGMRAMRGPLLGKHGTRLVEVRPGTALVGPKQTPAVLTYSYRIATTEVTQALYSELMDGPGCVDDCAPELPVHGVTWMDAVVFCNRLSLREGLTPVYYVSPEGAVWDTRADGYRLPTEAEWTRAAQAEQLDPFAGSSDPAQVAWFGDKVWADDAPALLPANSQGQVHAAASLAPNAWGLYDMSGNVAEWVWDWEGAPDALLPDPTGPAQGSRKLVKGGSYLMAAHYAQVDARASRAPLDPTPGVGFRIARGPLP
ncbi:MAG: bifunctional serine/threonine-protein kinase/formylglycine-generating enzyme family protein [Myxococcota bacterium]|nr:bifunctional serine/threonine-protein kinase/formylglycine-generating enzyme family protein [Myxococcota bacterium]